MAKIRKVRIDRILLLLLISVSLIGLFVFGISKIYNIWKNRPADDNAADPLPVKTDENVQIQLEDYSVYKDDEDELGFSFIIAVMKFDSAGETGISFDLGNLQTSEKIKLNNVSKYINQLEEKGYKTGRMNIVNVVVSNNSPYTCNIFIPYKTDSDTLRIMNGIDASWMEFDLDKNANDLSVLKFDTEQNIEIGNSNVTVSSCYISTMMLHNGEEYQIPSTLSVYTFRIHVNNAEENLIIEDARFVRDNNDEVIECLSEEYESVKVGNCLHKKLVSGDNGALFFETSSGNSDPDYKGCLMLKFSSSNNWVKISTTLE